MPRREFRNSAPLAVLIASRIAPTSAAASMMFLARSRPRWRRPALAVGRAKEGVSMIPLLELPRKRLARRRRLQYVSASGLIETWASVAAATHDRVASLISRV